MRRSSGCWSMAAGRSGLSWPTAGASAAVVPSNFHPSLLVQGLIPPADLPRPHADSLPVYWDVAKLTGRVSQGSLPMWLLVRLLNRFIRNGVLRLIAADGSL